MEKLNRAIESSDNSNPSKGRNAKKAALNPNAEIIPIPHAAHPGAKTPKKTPMVPRIPIFFDVDFTMFVLYNMRLISIPNIIPIAIRLTKE